MFLIHRFQSTLKKQHVFHDIHPTSLNALSASQNLTYLDWMRVISLLCLAGCSTGCGFMQGWQMDYGRPPLSS